MSLISATWYARPADGPGWYARETRTFGTIGAARAWAATVVPPVVTTRSNYWRDMYRAEHVELTRVAPHPHRRKARFFWRPRRTHAGYYCAPVVLVPSVGELGVAP